jgi:hypothetical protein
MKVREQMTNLAGEIMDVIDGMRGFCVAKDRLDSARGKLEARMKKAESLGRPETAKDAKARAENERVLLGLTRACNHLDDALVDLPDECWALMQSVGLKTEDRREQTAGSRPDFAEATSGMPQTEALCPAGVELAAAAGVACCAG